MQEQSRRLRIGRVAATAVLASSLSLATTGWAQEQGELLPLKLLPPLLLIDHSRP